MQLSPVEILVVAVIALIVLGPERLPRAARQLGKLVGELKNLSAGVQAQVDEAMRLDERTQAVEDGAHSDSESDETTQQRSTEGFRLIDGQKSQRHPSNEDA